MKEEIKNRIISIVILLVGSFSLNAQDIHFSQYRETPILVNPAQTALNRNLRIISNYKEQWRNLGAPYKTGAFSVETALKNQRRSSYLGVGLQLYNDQSGDGKMTTSQALLSLTGIVKVSKFSKLSTGIMAGIGQRSINYNALKWNEQYNGTSYDPSLPSGENQTNSVYKYPDLGAGICWSYGKKEYFISANNGNKAMIGISGSHFNIPRYSYNQLSTEKLRSKIIVHGNMEIAVKRTNMLVIPEFLYVRQGKTQELNAGVMLKYILVESSRITGFIKGSAVGLGLNYRNKDAMITSVLFEHGNFAIGLSYDVNLSPLKAASKMQGGFEIALRFVTPNPFLLDGKARF